MTQWEIFWEPLTTVRGKLSSTVNKNNKPKSTKPYTYLFILAVILPLIGWGAGASINPDGWMSDQPFIAYFYVLVFAGAYWYITLTVIFFLTVYFYLTKAGSIAIYKTLSVLAFIASLVFSIFMMTLVKDANSSEFTG